ncbi:hypothetical protein TL16_g03388 [Triparma laevis f. inornata]|uniref:VTT domain-containing protein n=1 Tax=Triparma laevis f. inornata TaxID=1714386 RepID=A0A9W7A327_9STRA|nr:hypothetical protein TL16_g03388 [Triparma laevis f. inornata]
MSAAAASLLTNADSPTTSSSSSPDPSSNSNNPCTLKRVVLLCLFVLIILIVADGITGGSDSLTSQTINSILSWISENPAAGIFIFSLIYIVATILFVPGSLLTLGSGFSFAQAFGSPLLGTVAGSASVIMGASVGATLAFLLGRYIFRDEVTGWLEKENGKSGSSNFRRYWKSIDRALGVQGLKIMFLLRLSPLFPFNLLNYLAGTTAISLKDYCVSLLGIIPGTILYVYLGAASSDLASAGKEGGETLRMVFLIVGAIAGERERGVRGVRGV